MTIGDLYYSWWLRPGTTRTLKVDGLTRSYVIHLPKGHDCTLQMPVVLALHGATMNGPMMASFCGLNRKADEAGFIVVYPNGTGINSSFFWNGGNCCGAAMQNKVDDVAFINALLDDLFNLYSVDRHRVYVTGLSNGGIMAYRLACELSARIAAIAPVAATLGTEISALDRPVSVLHFHGSDDEYIPLEGGRGKKSLTGTNHRSVKDAIATWVKANGCHDESITEELASDSEISVIRKTYSGGQANAEVVLVIIEGGGHTWPGMRSPTAILGKSTLKISANDLMWEFFQKHPIRGL